MLSLMSPYRTLGGNDIYIADDSIDVRTIIDRLKTLNHGGKMLIKADEGILQKFSEVRKEIDIKTEAIQWNETASMKIYRLTLINTDNED